MTVGRLVEGIVCLTLLMGLALYLGLWSLTGSWRCLALAFLLSGALLARF